MTTPEPAPAERVSRQRRAVRLTLLILTIAVLTAFAASLLLSGR
jgi:hypothetical protein